MLGAKAGDVKLQQHRMVNEPIDRRRRRHLITKDPIPMRENQIAGDEDRAALVAFGEQREENLGFLGTLLDVADVVDLCGALHNAEHFWPGGAAGRGRVVTRHSSPRRWAKNGLD